MTGLIVQTPAPKIYTPDIGATVSLRDFYRKAADVRVPTNPKLFLPDSWSKILAEGLTHLLEKPGFPEGDILEVGVGTGLHMLGIMTGPNAPKHYIGTDICGEAVEATTHLAQAHNLQNVTVIQSNLLKNVPRAILAKVRHFFACIPQVVEEDDGRIGIGNEISHKYVREGGAEEWNDWGLGLNATLLEEATTLVPEASVTLNLAGRPPFETLSQMFAAYGRKAEILHSQIIPQHAGTELTSLANMEKSGVANFEFYKDEAGTQRIGAVEAEKRRLGKQPLFHKIYVLHAPGL